MSPYATRASHSTVTSTLLLARTSLAIERDRLPDSSGVPLQQQWNTLSRELGPILSHSRPFTNVTS
jgi:hypothetical protein